MLKRALPVIVIALVAIVVASNMNKSSTVHLRILETTDIHTHIVDYDYFQDQPSATVGLVRTATLVRAARAEVSNSVLVDNGDLLQGNPFRRFYRARTRPQ